MKSYNSVLKKRDLLIKHYLSPDNKLTDLKNYQLFPLWTNTDCSDYIKVYYQTNNGVWTKLGFTGEGCIISIAATDILLTLLINLDKKASLALIKKYENIVRNSEEDRNLPTLNIFSNVSQHANRINCALLSSNTIKNFLSRT